MQLNKLKPKANQSWIKVELSFFGQLVLTIFLLGWDITAPTHNEVGKRQNGKKAEISSTQLVFIY